MKSHIAKCVHQCNSAHLIKKVIIVRMSVTKFQLQNSSLSYDFCKASHGRTQLSEYGFRLAYLFLSFNLCTLVQKYNTCGSIHIDPPYPCKGFLKCQELIFCPKMSTQEKLRKGKYLNMYPHAMIREVSAVMS